MSITRRLAGVARAKANAILEDAEDPREMLDLAYGLQQELLAEVRRGLTDVATERKRIELRQETLRRRADRLLEQAEQAVSADDDELAQQALALRAGITARLAELGGRHERVKEDEERLTQAVRRLQAKLEDFRVRKETLKAEYTAAKAHTWIREITSGISAGMDDIDLAIRRAEDRTARLKARYRALEEAIASGAGAEVAAIVGADDLQDRLDALSVDLEVRDELARLKAAREAEAAGPEKAATAGPEAET